MPLTKDKVPYGTALGEEDQAKHSFEIVFPAGEWAEVRLRRCPLASEGGSDGP
jgi:hypothetical protein